MNWSVVPAAMLGGELGVMAIDTRVAAVTVIVVVPDTAPRVAVIVTGPPALTPVAKPPGEEIVAVLRALEVQDTELVRFWVLESENVPVAVNC